MKRLGLAALVALAVTACGGAQTPSCPPDQIPCGEIEPVEASPSRNYIVKGEVDIEGVAIDVTPYSASGWAIRVANQTDGSLTVVWDESSFVASNGEAQGRMIRGDTRQMDIGRPQTPTPIPPKATASENVFVEKLIGYEREETRTYGNARTKTQNEEWKRVRKRVAAAIVGGKLHLTIDVNGTKKTWTGVVVSNTAP